jgi:hypothetical protein
VSAELDFSMHAALDSMSRPAGQSSDLPRDVADPRFAAKIWPVNCAAPQWSGTGTYDVPQVFGPKDGHAWVVRRITAATFTAGTVNVYRGLPADNNQVYAFTAAGVFFPGGASLVLLPGDRLTFAAAAGAPVTGPVTISLDAVQLTLDLLPRFLL